MSYAEFLGYDPDAVKEVPINGRAEPLAPGEYTMMCVDAKLKDTKSGTGKFWELRCQEKDTGHEITMRFNVQNQSADAQRMGQGQMKHYLATIGVTHPRNEEDITNIPFKADVIIKERPWTTPDGVQATVKDNEIAAIRPFRYETKTPTTTSEPEDAPW